MVLALIIPFCGGPLLCSFVLRMILVLEQCKVVSRRTPSQLSVVTVAPATDCLPAVLTVVFVLSYFSNMVLAELLLPSSVDLFTYMVLKQVGGYLFYIIIPLSIIILRPEFREEVGKVFRENRGKKELTQEEKEREISKEMLYH